MVIINVGASKKRCSCAKPSVSNIDSKKAARSPSKTKAGRPLQIKFIEIASIEKATEGVVFYVVEARLCTKKREGHINHLKKHVY